MNLLRRRPLAVFLAATSLLVVIPSIIPPASAAGPGVEYSLRHDFSMVPGLPGHGKNEPTSCYDAPDGKGYLCRIVAGYEETGDDRNFTVQPQDALDVGHDRYYGSSLVSRRGYVYEGCEKQGTNWACDYRTRRQISRQHYESKGYVSQVFWKWKDYLKEQLACAGAITGLWGGVASKGFLVFLDDCNNGPL